MNNSRFKKDISLCIEELYKKYLPEQENNAVKYYDPKLKYYSPNQASKEKNKFAICLVTVDGDVYTTGDCKFPFSLQSISKVFSYSLALDDHGRDFVLSKVGVEPSGEFFHSITFDRHNNRPHNPMVNAGALVTSNLIKGDNLTKKFNRVIRLMRLFSGNKNLELDNEAFKSELLAADRNRAIAYFMRSKGMIEGRVTELISLYLKQCTVMVNSYDLAVMAATLANGYVNPITKKQVLPIDHIRDVLSVLYTCGMYNFAGQWAFEIGFPAKSGVSGGILAVIPGKGGLGIYSPGLDSYGNSVRGIKVCRDLSKRHGLHVFASETEDSILNEPT